MQRRKHSKSVNEIVFFVDNILLLTNHLNCGEKIRTQVHKEVHIPSSQCSNGTVITFCGGWWCFMGIRQKGTVVFAPPTIVTQKQNGKEESDGDKSTNGA